MPAASPPGGPLLVMNAPMLLRRGIRLTDGQHSYLITDTGAVRGVPVWTLVNEQDPVTAVAFTVEELGELAYASGVVAGLAEQEDPHDRERELHRRHELRRGL